MIYKNKIVLHLLSSWRATTLISNIIANINWLIDVYINLNEPNVIQLKRKTFAQLITHDTSRSDFNFGVDSALHFAGKFRLSMLINAKL